MYAVFKSGLKRRLVWGEDASGKMRAKTFYDELSISDQAKFEPWFQMMADNGPIRNDTKYRQVGNNLYEFKIHKRRIVCFHDADDLVLVDGFTKKDTTSRRSQRNLATAERLRDDYLKRKQA